MSDLAKGPLADGRSVDQNGRRMSIHRRHRGADSSLVQGVTLVTYDADVVDETLPDGCWDIVVITHRGRVTVLQTGLITQPVRLPYCAGDEYMCISFKPGVYMPRLPGERTVDKGIPRPLSTRRSFWLETGSYEIPTFENAEGLVTRLVRHGLITRDDLVEGVVEGRPRAASPRSVQRHFLHTTGVTAKQLSQIVRARQAVDLLGQGRRAVEVAQAAGYADQPHMTRALKAIMGRTPGEIVASVQEPEAPGHGIMGPMKQDLEQPAQFLQELRGFLDQTE